MAKGVHLNISTGQRTCKTAQTVVLEKGLAPCRTISHSIVNGKGYYVIRDWNGDGTSTLVGEGESSIGAVKWWGEHNDWIVLGNEEYRKTSILETMKENRMNKIPTPKDTQCLEKACEYCEIVDKMSDLQDTIVDAEKQVEGLMRTRDQLHEEMLNHVGDETEIFMTSDSGSVIVVNGEKKTVFRKQIHK